MELETEGLIPDLKRWKRAYLKDLTARNYSPNTVNLYGRVIELFIEHMREFQDEIGLGGITRPYIVSFLAWVDQESIKRKGIPLSPSTKTTYLKGMRSFLVYVSDNNDEFRTFERIFKGVRIADSSHREDRIHYFTKEEISRLFSSLAQRCEKDRDNYVLWRNALLSKVLYYAGLRASEALKMRWEDIESDGKYLRLSITAKGGKKQFAYIERERIEKELDHIRRLRERKLAPEGSLVFLTKRGRRLRRENAYTLLKKEYRKAGLPFGKKGLHILRHSLAMHLVQAEIDSAKIQKVLRHASITTTMVYAKVGADEVKGAISSL
jgi:integrase/recombinase XerD